MRKLIALVIILISVNAHAGTPRPLKGIGITATVMRKRDKDIYYYRYNICNPATNPMAEDGILGTVEINISRTDDDAQLSWAGLNFRNFIPKVAPNKPPSIDNGTEYLINKYRDQYTPVGIEQVPKESHLSGFTTRWTVMLTFDKKTNIMSPAYGEWPAEPVKGLLPGKCLDNFVLSSPALPAIRYAKAESAYIMTKDDIPNEESTDPEYIEEFYNDIAWHGKTIAPKAPPVHFMPVAFLNYIVSLKQQS
ncbi:MAG: hypothetical protein M1491_10080, partial [Deltaproteobacteria bacterium]|nr:hypothetical protein [Deltaproteobacteria bacterium]